MAPELLVRWASFMSQPLPKWVIVPALVNVGTTNKPTTLMVQVPEATVMVPLLVKPLA